MDSYPNWNLDGRDVIYFAQAESGLFRQSADGTGSAWLADLNKRVPIK